MFERYEMYQKINKLFLAGDKLIPEMYLRQPGYTYSVSEPFTVNKERMRKF